MKPVLSDGKLTVELNVHEKGTLAKCRDIGVLLDQLHQPCGAELIAAIDSALAEEPELPAV